MTEQLQRLALRVRGVHDSSDPSHDFEHLMRVVRMCEFLGRQVDADLDILLPAAFLHDIVNVPKNHPDRARASAMAAERAGELLQDFAFSAQQIAHIATVISEHSYSAGKKPSSIESAVLQDADRLDSLGALGILRTATCGARMGAAYYDVEQPFATTRVLDDKKFTLDHFYTKLFKLAEGMNTPAAKELARRRMAFMRAFVDQLQNEIAIGDVAHALE